jgi:UDPglucose--hexose-1-phosphate uridylyltransferase
MNLFDHPHRRYNPLLDEWVLVSPQRTKRPWQGRVESSAPSYEPPYDPKCYLCPGNERAGGVRNPGYEGTFVFNNDFPALLPGLPSSSGADGDELLRAQPESGICRVICFSPRHDLSLSRMTTGQVNLVVQTWQTEYEALGSQPDIGYVQIFENRGELMGCSNPHPHGQIWASHALPDQPAKEDRRQRRYTESKGGCLLCSYLDKERGRGERLVMENRSFTALVPFWAVWPFEVLVLPRFHISNILELSAGQSRDLAGIIIALGVRYDNLFRTPFPYSMGIHQAPSLNGPHPHWHMHLHYYPPLLRSATVRKFMVGYEMLAMPQRDITAEESARRLREMSGVHYLEEVGA